MDSSNYSPDETPSQLFAEKTWLQGEILCAVAYGIAFTIFFQSIVLLVGQVRRKAPGSKIPLLVFTVLIFSLATIFMVSDTAFTQLAFITYRNYPGGPAAVETDFFSLPIDEAGNVAFVLANWLADIVMVWRCRVIYQGCRFPMYVVLAGPCLLYLGSLVTGSFWLRQISTTSPYGALAINWTIPYLSLSLALNILVTLAIAGRLFLYRRRITRTMGSGYGGQYASVASMIIESSAIYSCFSLLFLVPFGLNSPISEIFLQALGEVQVCAALLIVMRVAQGRAWTPDKTANLISGQVRTGGTGSGAALQLSAIRYGGNPSRTLATTETTKSIDYPASDATVSQFKAGASKDEESFVARAAYDAV